jgi:hypothetical protein
MSALATSLLTGTVAAAISDEEVLQSNRLGWVTQHFLIIRDAERQNHTIIPLARVGSIDVVKTPYSGLLAIVAGLLIIAAAAFTSKQGDGAAIPAALLGAFLTAIYFGSRRAIVTFKLDSGGTETASGPLGEVKALIQLLEAVRTSEVRETESTDFSTAACASSSVMKGPKTAHPVFESSGLV